MLLFTWPYVAQAARPPMLEASEWWAVTVPLPLCRASCDGKWHLKLQRVVQPGSTASSRVSTRPRAASAASCLLHWTAAVASVRISKYQKGGTASGCSFLPRALKKRWWYCVELFLFYIGFINRSLKIRTLRSPDPPCEKLNCIYSWRMFILWVEAFCDSSAFPQQSVPGVHRPCC